jgi:hypothetical protein
MSTATYQLLQIIGSPFINSHKDNVGINLDELYTYAKNNRMPLLYLRSIVESGIKNNDYKDYIVLTDRWIEIEERIKKLIKILDDNDIPYTTFKSIKPYREVTVDIDLLIINSYNRALDSLEDSGYKLLAKGPLSSTFRDARIKMDYDIYDEVGISHIIYFDKDKSLKYIVKKEFQTGGYIDSLAPSIDLLSIIAHSVIKEQMYTLAEYYSTLYYLREMGDEDLRTFIEMADVLMLRNAVKAHVGLTYSIHRMAHGMDPPPLKKIVSNFGINGLEAERNRLNGYGVPHKFHPITLMECFREKLHESKSRRSFARQARSMMSPVFVVEFFPKFLSHIIRETY